MQPAPIAGTSAVPSAEARSAATAAGPTPGPEEVIMKKAALVTMQKQMAALVRGEDLPASQPGARGSRHALCSTGGGKGGH